MAARVSRHIFGEWKKRLAPASTTAHVSVLLGQGFSLHQCFAAHLHALHAAARAPMSGMTTM
eukprot:455768-Pyramimonas_sp.AAC.1